MEAVEEGGGANRIESVKPWPTGKAATTAMLEEQEILKG
jgi:hypothetical protein